MCSRSRSLLFLASSFTCISSSLRFVCSFHFFIFLVSLDIFCCDWTSYGLVTRLFATCHSLGLDFILYFFFFYCFSSSLVLVFQSSNSMRLIVKTLITFRQVVFFLLLSFCFWLFSLQPSAAKICKRGPWDDARLRWRSISVSFWNTFFQYFFIRRNMRMYELWDWNEIENGHTETGD